MVGLGLSNRFSVEAVKALYEGVRLACTQYKVDLVGGDTTSSQSGLTLSVTAIGDAPENRVVAGAAPAPATSLVVSGELGSAYMGLQILEREKLVFKEAPGAQPDLTGHEELLERQLKPEARTDVVEELAKLEILPDGHDRHLRRPRLRGPPHRRPEWLRSQALRGQDSDVAENVRHGPGVQP